MDPLTFAASIAGPAFGFIDSLVYTPQERAADETMRKAAAAQQEYARAQVELAQSQTLQATIAANVAADQSRTLLTLGMIGAGVVVAGLAVWSMR